MYIAAMFFLVLGWLFILGIVFVVMFVLGGIILAIGLISRYKNMKKGIKKKYPKICIITGGILLGISIVVFGVTAISFWSDSGNEYDPHKLNPQYEAEQNEKIMMDIIRCLEEEDVDTIKGMFSSNIINSVNIDTQIQEALEFYNGIMVTYEEFDHGSLWQSDSYEGRYVYKATQSRLLNISTDEGKVYILEIINVVVDDENPDNLGLRSIRFLNPDNLNQNMLFIGLP